MYQSHSQTSKAAYATVDEQGQLDDVMAAFRSAGTKGATCEEILTYMHEFMPHRKNIIYGTVSARMTTLKNKGWIFYKNQQRKTTSDKLAEVWVHEQFATDAEKLWTAQKLRPDKEVALEKIENAERFLASLEESKEVSSRVWLAGMRHNIAELKAARGLLK